MLVCDEECIRCEADPSTCTRCSDTTFLNEASCLCMYNNNSHNIVNRECTLWILQHEAQYIYNLYVKRITQHFYMREQVFYSFRQIRFTLMHTCNYQLVWMPLSRPRVVLNVRVNSVHGLAMSMPGCLVHQLIRQSMLSWDAMVMILPLLYLDSLYSLLWDWCYQVIDCWFQNVPPTVLLVVSWTPAPHVLVFDISSQTLLQQHMNVEVNSELFYHTIHAPFN